LRERVWHIFSLTKSDSIESVGSVPWVTVVNLLWDHAANPLSQDC